ncbi:MAG: Pycsar system effector family protein [Candidatus Kapaibacterium sp.]
MEQQTDIITKASQFVFDLFEEHLSNDLVYHTYDHTKSVADTAEKIGKGMKLGEEGIEIVVLAGWLHDTGYTELYTGHEEISIRIATEFLEKENYPEDKIALVADCIRATKIPQQPKNLLEEIVADADLAGLGRKSFFKQSDLLHLEWEKALGQRHTEAEWIKQNIDLLARHTFFTSFARQTYRLRQDENLELLHKKLRKLNSPQHSDSASYNNQGQPGDREHPVDSNSQMIFKLVSNTLMMENLSADHKALMMILANCVILTISLTGVLATRMGGNYAMSLHIAFAFLSVVCLSTMILAVCALKQKKDSEDTEERKQHPPLFGNFSAMSYDEFDQRMKEMNTENDFLLYSKMTRDYFDQRILVAKKYQYIHLSFTTFMYGFCLTIVIALVLLFIH